MDQGNGLRAGSVAYTPSLLDVGGCLTMSWFFVWLVKPICQLPNDK
jgi:hypothetical protein